MKLRVLFLKKKHIIYLFVSAVLLVGLLLISVLNNSQTVFNIISDNKTIKADFTGDGEEDILYIKTDKDKYYLQVYSKEQSYFLEPDKKLGTVGSFYSYWPMKVSVIDINRDKVPEIFTQSSRKGAPVQHIFTWNSKEFKDIYCSTNNVIGFLDYRNNRTPKFISGNISNTKYNFTYYMYLDGNLQNINYENGSVPGSDIIPAFIQFIESLPGSEAYLPREIFYPGLTGKDLTAIGKLSGENNLYIFQDASFNDSKWDKEGHITEMKWTVNFKANSRTVQDQTKYLSITLKLKPHLECGEQGCFKIYSIILN